MWADLPRRRAALGITVHRKPWSAEEALSFVQGTLAGNQGSWTVGEHGASATFAGGSPTKLGLTLLAQTPTMAVRFTGDDRVRVLAISASGGQSDPTRERIILAIPRSSQLEHPAVTLTAMGCDAGAIRVEDCAARLFDLGLGRPSIRVGLRTHDRDLAAALDRQVGSPWAIMLADLSDQLPRSAETAWVVESPLARIEVAAAVTPSSGGFCHLDPASLALDRATPPGLDLPPTFVPCACFEPAAPPSAPVRVAGTIRRLVEQV